MNKFTKLLSVFVIAGAIGTGVAGAVGCNNNPDTPDGPGPSDTTHNHQTWSKTGTDNKDGKTHKLTCTTEGCTETKDEAHVDEDEDDVCDVCEAELEAEADPNAVTKVTITAAKEKLDAGEEIQLSVTVAPATASQEVTWSITDGADLAEISATGKLKIKDTVTGGGEVTVKAVSKATTTKSHTKTFVINKQSEYHRLKADTEHNIVAEDFETDKTVTQFSGTYGTKGIYYWGDGKDTTTSANAVVANGIAKHNTGASGTTKTENVSIVYDLGEVKDVVEGYVEVTPDAVGNDWGIFQLVGTSAQVTNNTEVFAVHTATSQGLLDYRLDGKTGTVHESKDEITLAANKTVGIYFKLNMVTGKITVKIGEDTLCENADVTISDVKAIVILSSNSGLRQVAIDNLAVNTAELTAADVAADLKGSVAALNTAAVALKGEAWASTATETSLATAKTTAETALDAADVTKQGALSAYATYESAVYDALAVEYLARLQAKYPASNYTTAGEEGAEVGVDENVQAYANAITAATTAFGAVDSLDGFAEVLAAQDAIVDEILTNSELVVAKVTITLYDAEDAEIGKLTGLLDGSKLTLEKIKKAVTVDKKIGKVYTTNTEGTLSGEVTGEYTVTAKEVGGEKVDTDDAKLYVEVTAWSYETLDLAAIKAEYDKEDSGIAKDNKGFFKIQQIHDAKTGEEENTALTGLVKYDSFEMLSCVKGVEFVTLTSGETNYLGLRASGNTDKDNGYFIKALKDVTLTVTYNAGDSSNVGGKGGKLMYAIGNADPVTVDVATSSATQVYTAKITLKAGEEVDIYSSGNRLVIYGIDTKY